MSQEVSATSFAQPQKTKKRLEKSKVPEPDSDDEATPTPTPTPTAISGNPTSTPEVVTPPPPQETAPVEVFRRRKYILSDEAKEARRQNLENARKVRAELAIIRANLKKEEIESKRSARQERLERIENERRLKMEQEIEEEVGRRVMRELSARPVQVRSSSQTRRQVHVVAPSSKDESMIQPQTPQIKVIFH